jgi:alpha-N-arabinofuranosidase
MQMNFFKHLPKFFLFSILFLCCFAGFGQQKINTVFKPVTSTSIVRSPNTYFITKDITVAKPVSPLLYGSMMELGFGRSENPWAEMLYNRDFEDDKKVLGQGWLQYDRAAPQLEDWWNTGYDESKWFLKKSPDDTQSTFSKEGDGYWPSAHGKNFISLDNKSKTDAIYFAQDSVYLHKNMGYNFSGLFSNGSYFSADKFSDRIIEVTVGLYADGDFTKPLAEKKLSINTIQFNLFETSLPPVNYEGFATFAIKLDHQKKVSFDLLSLMPANNRKGWRNDVVELAKNNLPSAIMRFPGGCFASLYNWRDGVGKCDQRPVNYETWWGNALVNDVGTGEFVDFCRMTNQEPFLCVPVMFGTPENARDWVDFCNNPKNEQRIKAGYTQPFNVKYWELDNETYRRFDAITYAQRSVEFAKAMKKVDPKIKIVMGNYWVFHDKFKEMLEIAYPYIDVITNRGGSMEEMESDLKVLAAINKKHHTNITLCHTEFRAPLERKGKGTDGLNKPKDANDKETLFTKAVRWEYGMNVLDQFIQFQNFGGDFSFANFVNFSDGWGENLINDPKEGPFLSAVGEAYKFLRKLSIVYPVKIENKNMDGDVVLQAAWNKQKTQFTLIILNFSGVTKELPFNLKDLATSFKATQKIYEIATDKLTDFNSPSHKDAITLKESESQIKGNDFTRSVLPNTATAIVFEVK